MNKNRTKRYFIATAILTLSAFSAHADLQLSDNPLFLSVDVTPNVIMTLDASASMANAYTPEEMAPVGENSADFNLRRYSSPWNAQYYNPAITYKIPLRTDPLQNENVIYSTSFTKAYENGFNQSKGHKNLNSEYVLADQCYPDTNCPPMPCLDATLDRIKGSQIGCPGMGEFTRAQKAYYHLYYGDHYANGKALSAKPQACNPDSRENESCYISIEVGDESKDISPGKNASAKEQNFANWYSFYRTRALAAMSAAMTTVSSLGEDEIRLAWQTLSHRFPSGDIPGKNAGCARMIPDPNKPGTRNAGLECKGDEPTTKASHENRMRTLDAFKTGDKSITHRRDFYDWLAHMQVDSGTPLRSATQRAGEYYRTSGLNSPYAEEPHVKLGTELSCRRNFHVLFTDGRWNGDRGANFGGNLDGSSSITLPKTYIKPNATNDEINKIPYRDITSYSSRPPYHDDYSDSVADLAFKYWITDLRPDADMKNDLSPVIVEMAPGNNVEVEFWNPRNNPATWQHMVNFTIGLGIGRIMASPNPIWDGNTYAGAYPDFYSGTTSWPETDGVNVINSQEKIGHVYDLWHAAINSRGQFFSAERPDELQKAFDTIFKTITGSTGASASYAGDSNTINVNSVIFEASFDSKNWSGEITARSIDPATRKIIDTPLWTSHFLPPSTRKIFTWNGANGVKGIAADACNNLSTSQQAALNTHANGTVDNLCADRLNWLRGDSTKEVRNSGGIFRNRLKSTLGDIINSNPVYIHNDNENDDYKYDGFRYEEALTYRAFFNKKASHPPMLYVGANDGMLHAFKADTDEADSGQELFAYMPHAVFGKLSNLTDPNYTHQYYVNGSPVAADAYLSGVWKTILVGGLNGGGKSIYALDVTAPESFNAANVLWEFSDAGLGYTFSEPQVGRMKSGQWAVVFGSGYFNSVENPDAQASLYIVPLEDPAKFKKITVGATNGNGLSSPLLYDKNFDGIVDTAYAGDLQGNIWKFDLDAAADALWKVANNGNPVFTATNASGQGQPITSRPGVTPHPAGGVVINFGTGQLLASSDKADKSVQTLYGIWDKETSSSVLRTELQQQKIDKVTTAKIGKVRITSANSVDWSSKKGWYLDLELPVAVTNDVEKIGERVVVPTAYRNGRLEVVSYTPNTNDCSSNDKTVFYLLDPLTGSRLTGPKVDINLDGLIDSNDLIDGMSVSGFELDIGYSDQPHQTDNGNGTATSLHSGDKGDAGLLVEVPASRATRIFWQQLQ